MMAGNPNWWGMFPPSLFPPQFPSASLPFASFADLAHHQPQSWSQLLLGDEDRLINQTQSHYQPKKLENWEDQILNPSPAAPFVDIVKQEVSNESNRLYAQAKAEESLIQAAASRPPAAAWSCPSTLTPHTDKFLNFSYNNKPDQNKNSEAPDLLPESNRSAAGGACKKARVHPPSSSQPPLKVRKEKLVDRITALHQIVSPFGKTDTASVLTEAIGYIRFLQGQIEALSYPYLRSAPKDLRTSQPTLLNDPCLKRKVIPNPNPNPNPNQGDEEMMSQEIRPPLKDLRSRGLCLVPLSCTQLVGGDNNGAAAAYWAPAYGTGF